MLKTGTLFVPSEKVCPSFYIVLHIFVLFLFFSLFYTTLPHHTTPQDPEVDAQGNKKADALTGHAAQKAYDNNRKRPVMIHRAILGSLERCIAILAEHYKGKWPFWVSPRQAIVIPVAHAYEGYAREVRNLLYSDDFEVVLDDSDDTLNKKVRKGQVSQYNFILVVGENEQKNRSVAVRTRNNEQHGEKTLDEMLAWFQNLRSTQDPSF